MKPGVDPGVVERARARILRAHGDALSPGVFRSLLVEPTSQFRGLTYEEFLARLRGHVARFDAMGEDDLVAYVPGARGRSRS